MSVSFNNLMGMWHAYKKIDKQRVHLGYYGDRESALIAEAAGEPQANRLALRLRSSKPAKKSKAIPSIAQPSLSSYDQSNHVTSNRYTTLCKNYLKQ